jgi:phenylacetate-coenzyme A ligase PaaK-like adenylate-forming protein
MNLLATLRRSAWTMAQFRPSRYPPDRLRRVQEERFRKLLRHAVAHSPFYREKYRGIDLERCAPADLPPTTKAELMANFDRVVTDRAVTRAGLERFIDDPENVGGLFLGKYPVCHTSGSQGQPMLVVQDRLVLDLLFAFQMTRGNLGYRRWDAFEAAARVFSPARLAVVISKPGFFPSAWAWQHLPESMRPFLRTLYVAGNDPDLIAKLNDFRPTILTTTPTTMDTLAVRADQLRLGRLRQAVTWSEILTDAARGRIAKALGVPVLDNYGCGECIYLSTGCPTHPGAHVNADRAVFEVVDDSGRPVPNGTLGHKALLTNLANFVQPLIRYEIGDRLAMAAAPCACGSRLPRIERIGGRVGDVFWVRSGAGYRTLSAYPFQHAFEYLREVREWQATQEDRNRIRVRFEMLPGAALDADKARVRLNERLALAGFGDDLEVRFEVVPRLSIDPGTGKFRRLVSLVGPPADLPGTPATPAVPPVPPAGGVPEAYPQPA